MSESANNTVESAANNTVESANNTVESAKNTVESAKNTVESAAKNTVESAKNAVDNIAGGIIPPQPPIEPQSDAHVLKSRLEWGEPAFTILDVRDRYTYNQGHIMGAMPYPIDELVDRAVSSLDKSRDIYVYGENEEQTSQAAQSLKSAGFVHVSELKGGLAAWKAVGGPTEGIVESRTPAGADDYNVIDRLKNHAETQQKNV
ncbi:MAG: rhodanese-like domain-containing protein [Scytonema sp. RU_4_4]|nr:rhodanese-like domain-containing protein [Scytonema sp. RU_4_4]NJR74628.1 rhodanese-like domain-containing protein [Scytonema sp. CRU_2_7]